MKRTLDNIWQTAREIIRKHKTAIVVACTLAVLAPTSVLVGSTMLVESYKQYVLSPDSSQHANVGIVMGAGITRDGRPYRELQARLDTAAQALERGQVDKLILSGDNSFQWYDEPGAMMRYLVAIKHIPASRLQPDYAGRDTYDTCKRASKVFGLTNTIIYSAGSHLPRAIFLCRHLGVTAFGVSSGVEAQNAWRREPLARAKAIWNIYIQGRDTILGPPIHI